MKRIHEQQNFEVNSRGNWKPVQLLKNRRDMILFYEKREIELHNSESFAADEWQREVHQTEESYST